MSRVDEGMEVTGYDDLRGDQKLHSKAKDVVVDEVADGRDVLWLADWLADKKELEPVADVPGLRQIVSGRAVAETEKAVLFTTTGERDPDADAPGTEWVPKSHTRLYRPPSGGADDVEEATGHRNLEDFV